MPENAIRIEGLRELERAFKLYGRGLEKGVREALEAAAEPIRFEAEQLALAEITRIRVPSTTVPWHRMRVGVTRRTAYIAPEQRGANTKKNKIFNARYARPNLKTKLLDEAMEPALAANGGKVEAEVFAALGDLGRMWARV